MYKTISIHLLLLLLTCFNITAQSNIQSGSQNEPVNLTPKSVFSFSSNLVRHTVHSGQLGEEEKCGSKGFEGMLSDNDNSPWLQANMDTAFQMSSLQIKFNPADYPGGLGSFYIFLSPYPMEHTDLVALLSSPFVEHIYVGGNITPETSIPLGNTFAQYLRIQSARPTHFSFSDIILMGKKADGALDSDNTSDRSADAESSSTDPVFRSVVAVSPSCADCNDAAIHLVTGGEGLSLSLDGGLTFQQVKGGMADIPVAAGTYNLVLKSSDGVQTDYEKNPVIVYSGKLEFVSSCGNGDFLNGFTGWTGGQGTHNFDGSITINNQTIAAPRHVILANPGGTDPNAPGINLTSPGGQLQFARLGSLGLQNNDAQLLTFNFPITTGNFNFSFNHAEVVFRHSLTDPVNQEAFFTWTVSVGNTVVQSQTFNARNGTMNQIGTSSTFFHNWQRECINLANFIGQTATVTFMSAGCAQTGHGGYAYIDGLCQPTAIIQAPAIQMNTTTCLGQPATVNILNSPNVVYDNYFWTVVKLDANNNPVPNTLAVGNIQKPVPILPLNDAIGFWSGITGQQANCGDKFLVTLVVVDANCNVGSSTATTTIECPPLPNYCNMAVCSNAGAQLQVQATGTICNTCDFEWFPKTNISNPFLPLPTISNPGALGSFYKVVVTSENGCMATTSLEVWDATLSGTLSVTKTCVDECSVRLDATFITNKAFNPSRVMVNAISSSNNLNFTYDSQIALPNGYVSYKFISQSFENKGTGNNGSSPENFTVSIRSITPPGFCNYGNCPSTISVNFSVNRGLFHGIPNAYVPNAFKLSSTNPVNRYFNPFFSNGITTPGVTWAEIKVFDRWGSLVYEKTSDNLFQATCASTTGFLGTEPGLPYGNELSIFPWNGYIGNNKYTNNCGPFNNLSCLCPQGTYTYYIRFKNCDRDQNGNPIIYLVSGDVLLLY